MKTIKSEEIRGILKQTWPDLTDDRIWPRDPEYKTLTISKLEEIIKACSVKDQYEYIEGGFDCDDFALQFKAAVRRYQYDEEIRNTDETNMVSWAIAECLGMRFKGQDGNHNPNLSITDQGVIIIEPQTDEYWFADDDMVYFVYF